MNVAHVGCIDAGGYLYHKAEKFYGKTYQVFINIYGAYSIAKDVFVLPPLVHGICKTIGYIGVADVFFAAPRLATALADRSIDAVIEVANVISLAAEIVDMCREIGFIPQHAFWALNHIHYAFLPSQCMSLWQSTEHTVCLLDLQKNISADYVNIHAKEIQQLLSLSKKHRLTCNTSQEFQVLKTRIHVACFLASIETVYTLASTILSSASLIVTTTPLMLTLYTATCVASIAHAILQATITKIIKVQGSAHNAVNTVPLLHKAM